MQPFCRLGEVRRPPRLWTQPSLTLARWESDIVDLKSSFKSPFLKTHLPPASLSIIQCQVGGGGGGGGEVLEGAFTTVLTEATAGQNETVSCSTFGYLDKVVHSWTTFYLMVNVKYCVRTVQCPLRLTAMLSIVNSIYFKIVIIANIPADNECWMGQFHLLMVGSGRLP